MALLYSQSLISNWIERIIAETVPNEFPDVYDLPDRAVGIRSFCPSRNSSPALQDALQDGRKDRSFSARGSIPNGE